MAHIPKPFQRPGVEIGHRSNRRWVNTRAASLQEGDIVQDKGAVVGVAVRMITVQVDFLSGEITYYSTDEVVRAFTEGVSVGDGE